MNGSKRVSISQKVTDAPELILHCTAFISAALLQVSPLLTRANVSNSIDLVLGYRSVSCAGKRGGQEEEDEHKRQWCTNTYKQDEFGPQGTPPSFAPSSNVPDHHL